MHHHSVRGYNSSVSQFAGGVAKWPAGLVSTADITNQANEHGQQMGINRMRLNSTLMTASLLADVQTWIREYGVGGVEMVNAGWSPFLCVQARVLLAMYRRDAKINLAKQGCRKSQQVVD